MSKNKKNVTIIEAKAVIHTAPGDKVYYEVYPKHHKLPQGMITVPCKLIFRHALDLKENGRQ